MRTNQNFASDLKTKSCFVHKMAVGTKRWCNILSIGLLAVSVSCNKKQSKPQDDLLPTPTAERKAPKSIESAPFPSAKTLLLAQAQFVWETDAQGKRIPKPGPARLVMLTLDQGIWKTHVLEDPESRVFHKAMCVVTAEGPRLLTIGGTDALLKLWEKRADTWVSKVLWHPTFGGKWDRLRDIEIGNVDHDPEPELVIATHDQGVVAVLDGLPDNTWKVTQVYAAKDTFIHEIEIGDVNGNGQNEFFATPSEPNKADHSQAGRIVAFELKKKKYQPHVIAQMKTSHTKEILSTTLLGLGPARLFAAVEAARSAHGTQHPCEIQEFVPGKHGHFQKKVIASLPNAVQARVLLTADLTGSGKQDLVVTTMKAGVLRLVQPQNKKALWHVHAIDEHSAGYEHAAYAADLDNNGLPELYVASDDDDEVRQYVWKNGQFMKTTIYSMKPSDLTWNIVSCGHVKKLF